MGDVSTKDLSIKSQKLTRRMKMSMSEGNAASVNQWEAGDLHLENGQNLVHSRGLISRSHGEGHVVFVPLL